MDISTSEFMHKYNHEYVVEHNKRYITLQKYISGSTVKAYKAPDWLMLDSVKELAKINLALAGYKIKRYEFKSNWLNEKTINQKIIKFEKLLEKARKDKSEFSTKIYEDISYKMFLLKRISNVMLLKTNLTYVNSHGDYSILQQRVQENKIKATIDFARACNLPAIWEIVRSYTYASKECEFSKINIENFKRYIYQYIIIMDLTEIDIKNILNIYYYQLILSTYGYKEYYKRDIHDKLALLKFAFWRTDMIRFIDNNGEDICNQLLVWFREVIKNK